MMTQQMQRKVAPLVGAWIEIKTVVILQLKKGSLPSWERGLKYDDNGILFDGGTPSLPSWERGLK